MAACTDAPPCTHAVCGCTRRDTCVVCGGARTTHTSLRMIATALLTAAMAAPRQPHGLNLTSSRRSQCPSAYGPGKHQIRMSIPDVDDPSFIWERMFDLIIGDGMPLEEERPTVLMWHGCGSDPEKFQEESEMGDRVARFHYYSIWPRGTSCVYCSAPNPRVPHATDLSSCAPSQLDARRERAVDVRQPGWNSLRLELGFPKPGRLSDAGSP
jgi:hypothetical protein